MNIALEKDTVTHIPIKNSFNLYLRNFIHFRCAFGVRFAKTQTKLFTAFFFFL